MLPHLPEISNLSLTKTHYTKPYINNGNRTDWSLIRSLIIQVINKIMRESDLCNHEYDYRPNWTTRSPVTNQS